MVKIPQHGANEELYDMNTFKGDIERFYSIDEWIIQVEWCLGENAQHIESISVEPTRIPALEFWPLYSGIHQTVDGCFSGHVSGTEQCTLEAIDSSFWKVSGSPEFEQHMQAVYGRYVPPSA
ncbi:MAG: hypothetical protein A3J71_06790 [Pseudomonadales bacterium RIFCSPHIGHO2_02_FULL_60_43]|nr:MAG: hypothetical protein A3J71_06790 [Pseudomonadales bacterium RIFCSPHIGHO2_02_FULL_60_43]